MNNPLKPVTKAGEIHFNHTLRLALAVGFLVLVAIFAAWNSHGIAGLSPQALWFLIIAAAVGAYMAMNIGANDVANNMGPAVGSGAITLGWAIFIAVVFEALGAIVAGGGSGGHHQGWDHRFPRH